MGDIKGGSSRARNILQHGLDWMKEEQFRASLGEKSKLMLDRLIVMHDNVDVGSIGYSLSG